VTNPWSQRQPSALVTELTYAGHDHEVQDQLEVASFAANVKAPSTDALGGRPGITINDGLGLAIGLFLAVAMLLALGAYDLGGLGVLLVPAAFGLGVLLTHLANSISLMVQRRRIGPGTDIFTLSVSPTELVVAGERTPARAFRLDEIARVEGGRRLTLRLRDASAVALPCLPAHEHAALAEELNERLDQARRFRIGYRDERAAVGSSSASEDAGEELPRSRHFERENE
jgi:hypothetical protein